ncbi:uncharacterized protein LOC117319873 isoform X3 [Pecten maximus]|nr:uncharacterized protein LOC117319873 isoform X3 [Pecten maximus]
MNRLDSPPSSNSEETMVKTHVDVSQIPLPSSSSSSPSSSPSSDRQTVAKVEDEGVPWLRSGKRRTLLGSKFSFCSCVHVCVIYV